MTAFVSGSQRRGRRAVLARALSCALLAGSATAGVVVGVAPAEAGVNIPAIPSENAADRTPGVVDSAAEPSAGVFELLQRGGQIFAGGRFTTVRNTAGRDKARTYLFSFKRATGAVTAFHPVLDGNVRALALSPSGRFLYVGGDFRHFNGVAVNRLVRYDLEKKKVSPKFRFPTAVQRVSDLQLVDGRLVVAGTFPGGITAVRPDTGAVLPYFAAAQAAGNETGYTTRIYRFAVNPTRDRMVVIGSFTSVGGQPRQQAAVLSLGDTAASVTDWTAPRFDEDCNPRLRWYTRDVDWAPDGQHFAIVTTGAGAPGTTKLCDTVTWWQGVDAPDQEPVWVNYSGGDTFHSVRVTDRGVFVGGHFRWLDNPEGRDSAGPGAVDRQGLGLIDTTTGKALDWNPTKSIEGGEGAYILYFTRDGLWVGHFEQRISHEYHPGLGLLPY